MGKNPVGNKLLSIILQVSVDSVVKSGLPTALRAVMLLERGDD